MLFDSSLLISQGFLTTFGTEVTVRHRQRVPNNRAMLVISNHRSFLDAPLVMTALGCPVRFACHHYMSQVPVLKDFISAIGCFPLDAPGNGHKTFFQTATEVLGRQQPVGIFPEGAQPMVEATQPHQMARFHRGFAHLALRAPIKNLTILPVAISSLKETIRPTVPLKFLSLFAPSEPLFNQAGWHPAVHYQRVTLSIGHPIHVSDDHREQYQGKQAGRMARQLTQSCYAEISQLLQEGFS